MNFDKPEKVTKLLRIIYFFFMLLTLLQRDSKGKLANIVCYQYFRYGKLDIQTNYCWDYVLSCEKEKKKKC